MGVRTTVVAVGVVAIALTGIETAAAQTVPTGPAAGAADARSPDGFMEFALPYSPYLVDLLVYAGRSVAEITYQTRRYDSITRSLVVNGLELRRDGLAASIGQIRVSSDEAVYEDVAIDTRALPLDPTTRAILRKLDREVVTGDIAVTGRMDAAAANYDLTASLRLDGAGMLEISAELEGFHILAPLADSTVGGTATVAGRLRSARIAFTDAGLVPVLYAVFGAQRGLTAEQAGSTASMMAGIGVAALFAELPGGSDPRLQDMARDWSATVQSFLIQPDRLEVALDPPTPVDLARLTRDDVGASDILALNPSVVSGTSPSIALVDPATITLEPDASPEAVLSVAEALIEGRGVPQDIARGVALILPVAGSNDRAAIGLLARALAFDPGVVIAQEQLRGAYVAVLLAKADKLVVADASLDALRRRLSPEELAVAEDDALRRWRRTKIGEEQRQTEIEAFHARDWPTIRRLAFAYYEGTAMPRNMMRAYGWASIASAGGDRIATGLRDDLTAAVSEGRIVLPLERARLATDDLWRLIVSDSPDDGTKPDPDAEQPAVPAEPESAPPPPATDTKPRQNEEAESDTGTSAGAAPASPSGSSAETTESEHRDGGTGEPVPAD